MKALCLFCLLCLSQFESSQAQPIVLSKSTKLSPNLLNAGFGLKDSLPRRFVLIVTDTAAFRKLLSNNDLNDITTNNYNSNIITIRAKTHTVLSVIAQSDLVTFIDTVRAPKIELSVPGFNNIINQVNQVHSNYPFVNGDVLTVSIKEDLIDSTDIDLRARVIKIPSANSAVSSHATTIATIIAGAGNSYFTAKGVAPAAKVISANFNSLLPEDVKFYQQNDISVQNHSYGTNLENYYGAEAQAYDELSILMPGLLHVFSSGNSGNETPSSGKYAGLVGVANITGNFKIAKNVLVVGAVDSFLRPTSFSSSGPAFDGRVKPELVAYGSNGTSGAAALASGISLLIQQSYKVQNHNRLPTSALVRAVLINTADRIGTTGLNFKTGFGNINAKRALVALNAKRYLDDSLTKGAGKFYNLELPPKVKSVKITICWNDPPSRPNEIKALVNDLDLELINQTTQEHWKPWVLSSVANLDSINTAAIRNIDTLNNVEQISLESPSPGQYKIHVNGLKMANEVQNFSICWDWVPIDHFEWRYPSKDANMNADGNSKLEWFSTAEAIDGRLDYTVDRGLSWIELTKSVNVQTGFFNWKLPNLNSRALLRATISNKEFVSDTFNITAAVVPNVDINCQDSVLITWHRPNHVSKFRVYTLGNKYLDIVKDISDTFMVVVKQSLFPSYYGVSALMEDDHPAIISPLVNLNTVRETCYFVDFGIQNSIGNTSNLNFELRSLHQVSEILLQRYLGNSYVTIQALPINGLKYRIDNIVNVKGINKYRVVLKLLNGQYIFSDIQTAISLANDNFILFPNPTGSGKLITLFSKDATENSFLLYDSYGRKVMEQKKSGNMQSISLQGFSAGIYFWTIVSKDKGKFSGKLVIR